MFVLGFIGQQLLLGRNCVAIEPAMRDQADMRAAMPLTFISALCLSGAFGIYFKGRSGGFWRGQGVPIATAVWAVASLPLYLTNYSIEPRRGIFVAKILAWELVAMAALGGLSAAWAKSDPEILDGGTF